VLGSPSPRTRLEGQTLNSFQQGPFYIKQVLNLDQTEEIDQARNKQDPLLARVLALLRVGAMVSGSHEGTGTLRFLILKKKQGGEGLGQTAAIVRQRQFQG
jgi:hypothetical protein